MTLPLTLPLPLMLVFHPAIHLYQNHHQPHPDTQHSRHLLILLRVFLFLFLNFLSNVFKLERGRGTGGTGGKRKKIKGKEERMKEDGSCLLIDSLAVYTQDGWLTLSVIYGIDMTT